MCVNNSGVEHSVPGFVEDFEKPSTRFRLDIDTERVTGEAVIPPCTDVTCYPIIDRLRRSGLCHVELDGERTCGKGTNPRGQV